MRNNEVNEGEFPLEKRNFKIWRAEPYAKSCFMVTPREVRMVGSKTNFIAASGTGTFIFGNTIVLGVLSEQLRKGGLFVGTNDFLQCIPSTIVTPVTNINLICPPLGFPLAIASEVPIFLGALMG